MKYWLTLSLALVFFSGCITKTVPSNPLHTYFNNVDQIAKHQCQEELEDDADVITFKECLRRCKINSYTRMQNKIKEELHVLKRDTLKEYYYYKNEVQD